MLLAAGEQFFHLSTTIADFLRVLINVQFAEVGHSDGDNALLEVLAVVPNSHYVVGSSTIELCH